MEGSGTMSSSEGGREIQLAKERLASAKARVESASKNFVAAKETEKIAKKGVNTAQLELSSSQSELKKATESLKAAEERYEVVTIDSDDEEEGNSKKKMKASTKTEARGEDTNEEENISQIVVMGCGSTEVNGVYVKKTIPSGREIFVKSGMRRGTQGEFILSTRGTDTEWSITFWPDSVSALQLAKSSERGVRRSKMYYVPQRLNSGFTSREWVDGSIWS